MQTQEPNRLRLATLPTPLVRLQRLGAELKCDQIWMKRDDLTGLELSGNKIRKLEYIVADALASGCDTLVTEGTCQSNHCRATAAVCAKLGLKSVLLLRPHPPDEPQGNHLLDTLFGAQIRCYDRDRFTEEREKIVEAVLAELTDSGFKPRWVPMGASQPLGCWGYARAMAELAEQLSALEIGPCDVIMPVSSGGTYAGALLGKLIYELDGLQLWGVPVSDDVAHQEQSVASLTRAAVSKFAPSLDFAVGHAALRSAMHFMDGYVGDGYAIAYPKAIEAIRLLAHTEGIVLDPVYTAKAFCALVDAVRDGRLGHQRPVIFIHTGGIFSDFAWSSTFSK